MKIKSAIILAGGMGTRLQATVPDLPKCMAPVNGIPFIDYVIEYLLNQDINDFVFALGYKADIIIEHLNARWPKINSQFSMEETPLGTGGAIKKALGFSKNKTEVIVNGDTLFKANLEEAANLHYKVEAECTLLLKPMKNFDRFGTVLLDEDRRVKGFREKQPAIEGLINGGVYILNTEQWNKHDWPEVFSFENDYLQKKYASHKIYGYVQDDYFIDIGIPEDYRRAQVELMNRI